VRTASAYVGNALAGGGWLLLVVIALLGLAIGLPRLPVSRAAYDHMVIFDVSQSMNVEDYRIGERRVSRLDYAKHAVAESLKNPDCDTRIGWGVFAGRKIVTLLAPVEVCRNYSALLEALDNIDGRMAFERSSEVQEGLLWTMLNVRDLKPLPSVIFMTDGHEAPPLPPERMRPYDGPLGEVRGWVVGVGGLEPQPIPKSDADGRRVGYWRATEVLQWAGAANITGGTSHEHLSELREPHLQQLAKNVGFGYLRLTDPASLDRALHDRTLSHPATVDTDLRWMPGLAALLLLGIWFRPDRLRRRPSPAA
jgi:mxaL protein